MALVVAGLLSDERIDRGEPIRANLLSFLASVAEAPEQAGLSSEELERMAAFEIEPFLDSEDDEALYGNEDAANSFYARAILGCIRVAPVLIKVMLEGLAHSSPRVRACAAMGVVTLAKTVVVRCEAPDELCQRRFIDREQRDGKIRPDRPAAAIEGIATGSDPWTQFEPLKLPLPTIRVNTECDYKPTLPEISAFCRDAAECLGAPLRA